MAALDEAGARESTLVVWTSDNGPWTQEEQRAGSVGPFAGSWLRDSLGASHPECTVCPGDYSHRPTPERPRKCVGFAQAEWTGIPCGSDTGLGSSWEGNLRVPAVVRWPGRIKPGTVSTELVSTLDIFPTVLAIAGVPPPTDRVIDGSDITAVLEGKAPSPHDFLFFYRQFHELDPKTNASITPPRPELTAVKQRSGNWKAHFATASAMGPDLRVVHDPPLLFQIGRDPAERWPVPTHGPGADPAATAALTAIVAAAQSHMAGVKWSWGDGLTKDRDPKLWLCCNKTTSCRCTAGSLSVEIEVESSKLVDVRERNIE